MLEPVRSRRRRRSPDSPPSPFIPTLTVISVAPRIMSLRSTHLRYRVARWAQSHKFAAYRPDIHARAVVEMTFGPTTCSR